jgi:hypothetical protein
MAALREAGIAQLVERNLAKVEVASSSLVSRSKCICAARSAGAQYAKGAQAPFSFPEPTGPDRRRNRPEATPVPTGKSHHGPAAVDTPDRTLAGWQSGYAAACKAVDAGSIPTPASIYFPNKSQEVASRTSGISRLLPHGPLVGPVRNGGTHYTLRPIFKSEIDASPSAC